MTPTKGAKPIGLTKAIAGLVFLIAACAVATFFISSTWSIGDAGDHVPRVVEAR